MRGRGGRDTVVIQRVFTVGIKTGAAKSGTYVKDRSVAGATYLKEKDWTKEKEMAGKAGQATKTWVVRQAYTVS